MTVEQLRIPWMRQAVSNTDTLGDYLEEMKRISTEVHALVDAAMRRERGTEKPA